MIQAQENQSVGRPQGAVPYQTLWGRVYPGTKIHTTTEDKARFELWAVAQRKENTPLEYGSIERVPTPPSEAGDVSNYQAIDYSQ